MLTATSLFLGFSLRGRNFFARLRRELNQKFLILRGQLNICRDGFTFPNDEETLALQALFVDRNVDMVVAGCNAANLERARVR
jgi:hypothetical protein